MLGYRALCMASDNTYGIQWLHGRVKPWFIYRLGYINSLKTLLQFYRGLHPRLRNFDGLVFYGHVNLFLLRRKSTL